MGAGPLILSWINEICSADTEKRALLVAMANDLAYVVQAVVSISGEARKGRRSFELTLSFQAPNFVWKTTEFPAAHKGYTWVATLQGLLSK
jgi:ACS family pantothenate transporter-like MFS transporter